MAKTLVVDDSAFTRTLLKNLLTALGHVTIGEAADVGPAIKAYGELSPELITLDIVMPSGSGVDVLRKIRESDKRTKIIVVTASAKTGLDAEVLKLGADAVLHKPFTAAEFRAKMLTLGSLGAGQAPSPRSATLTTLARESIIATAVEHAKGLDDWGPDPSFWEPFDKLLTAAQADGVVREKDAVAVAYSLATLLANRLLIQQYVKQHPAAAETPVTKPLAVVGLQSTGDILLSRLLAQNPAARAFLLYELVIPCFPGALGSDPRRRIAKEYFELESLLDESVRRMRLQRPMQYDMPDQGFWLLANAFASLHFNFQLPTYQAWLAGYDMSAAYKYLRLQLQVLLDQKPCPPNGHVLLHDPANHLRNLGTLLKTFPDARVVQTHRAVDEAVAEWCNVVESHRWTRMDHVDPLEVGRFVMKTHADNLRRGLAARKAADPARFIDVKHEELRQDPAGVVRKIEEKFGYPAGPKPSVDACKIPAPAGERKPLEHYGLTKEGVRKEFAAYSAEFGLPS